MAKVKENQCCSELLDETYIPSKTENEFKSWKNDSVFLYFTVFSVGLTITAVGAAATWTSPVMKHLTSSDPDINPLSAPITTYEVSALSGVVPLGWLFGPLLLGKMLDSYGRKRTILIMSSLNALSFIIIAFARTIYLYCLSRFLVGVSVNCLVGAVPIYITEITENYNRGRMGVSLGLFSPLGSLYSCLVGPYFSVKVFSLLCTLPALISIFLMTFFIPDSPIHMASLGENKKSILALKKFRKKSSRLIKDDLRQIQTMLQESHRDDTNLISLFSESSFRRAFIISVGANVFQIASGILLIMAFIGPIFDEIEIGFSGDSVGVIVISVKIVSFFVVSTTIETVGRKPLMLMSCFGASASLFVLGLYFYFKSSQHTFTNNLNGLPMISVILYFIMYALGLGPIPNILMSELFPSNVRTKAVSLILIITAAFSSLLSFGFPIVANFLGTASCFFIFSLFCLIAFIFTYCFIPETKGKDIIAIVDMLSRGYQ